MKKYICFFLTVLMIISLAGCGKDKKSDVSKQSSVNASAEKSGKTDSNIDVDLTQLSSTMVYSEVYNMVTNPSDYIGKTVKMNGQFSRFQATDNNNQPLPDRVYYACLIADATACCQQGLEFVLAGDFKYPDDYPKLGTDITVVGEFQTYTEDSQQYCHLVNAQFSE